MSVRRCRRSFASSKKEAGGKEAWGHRAWGKGAGAWRAETTRSTAHGTAARAPNRRAARARVGKTKRTKVRRLLALENYIRGGYRIKGVCCEWCAPWLRAAEGCGLLPMATSRSPGWSLPVGMRRGRRECNMGSLRVGRRGGLAKSSPGSRPMRGVEGRHG